MSIVLGGSWIYYFARRSFGQMYEYENIFSITSGFFSVIFAIACAVLELVFKKMYFLFLLVILIETALLFAVIY